MIDAGGQLTSLGNQQRKEIYWGYADGVGHEREGRGAILYGSRQPAQGLNAIDHEQSQTETDSTI